MTSLRAALLVTTAALVAAATAPTPTRAQQAGAAKMRPALIGWDRLPDWSGVWQGGVGIETALGPTPEYFDRTTADPKGSTGLEPGDREHPPYKPAWEARYAALLAAQRAGQYFDPLTNCLPPGFPRLLSSPFNIEFLVTPRQTNMAWEFANQTRRIYTDGRPHLPADELGPMWNGDSIGHWEGSGQAAALVIDTVNMKEGVFDRTMAPHSAELHVLERLRRIDHETMEDQITVEDPVAFEHPWKVVRQYKLQHYPNARVVGLVCEENNRAFNDNGATTVILPGEPGFKPLNSAGYQVPPTASRSNP